MFFVLSKILFFLLMPLTWMLVLLAYAWLTKRKERARLAIGTSLLLLLLCSNAFLGNEAFLLWEKEPVPMEAVGTYDAGIILTGFTSLEKSPHDRVYTNKGSDRFLHTLMLYKTGHIRKIIVSGGLGMLRKIRHSEAAEVKTLLLLAGVPEEDILLEDKSHNTYENAQFTRQLLLRHPELKRVVLVTSAFHMRRASACFTKAGVAHLAFPADFYSSDRLARFEYLFPSAEALAGWSRLVHEIAGFLIYKISGYC
ncbi:MAG: YdcF family protein [Adhaeribacter sp.]